MIHSICISISGIWKINRYVYKYAEIMRFFENIYAMICRILYRCLHMISVKYVPADLASHTRTYQLGMSISWIYVSYTVMWHHICNRVDKIPNGGLRNDWPSVDWHMCLHRKVKHALTGLTTRPSSMDDFNYEAKGQDDT